MKLEIELTRQDYADFNAFHFIRTRLTRSIIIALISLIALQFILNKDKAHVNIALVLVSSVIYMALYCFLLFLSLARTRNIPKEDGAILGKKELEFTDDQIICTDKDSASQYKWSAVKSMEENKKAFYLYLDTNMGIMIPKRFFKSEEERQVYKQFIQEKINVA